MYPWILSDGEIIGLDKDVCECSRKRSLFSKV